MTAKYCGVIRAVDFDTRPEAGIGKQCSKGAVRLARFYKAVSGLLLLLDARHVPGSRPLWCQ